MGGTPSYVWWGNARVTPYMHYQLTRLDSDLKRLFGVGLVANSGIRLPQEQIDIFLQRYVRAGDVRGRKVYDTRWWNGVLWYRISPAGTVAQPGTSNHEIQGDKAAVDIQDTGADAGITSKSSTRGRWLRANASNYALIASGDGFGEGWHFDIVGIWRAVPGGGGTAPATPKESDNMQSISINGNLYGVDTEFITHYGDMRQANITRSVTSATDELHNLGSGAEALANFSSLLDGLGIPRTVLNARGEVFNPESGKFEGNGTWSRRREILAGQARIEAKIDKLIKPDTK
ncbi:endolysin [Microbacterium phage HerculesXL]|nr:endolysin [Microbacterium phage HerculesXL]WNN95224.1 endolysin [Microbacterium phage Tinyman4]